MTKHLTEIAKECNENVLNLVAIAKELGISSYNLNESQEKNLISVTSKPIVDISSFTNIITDLRTFQSKFEHVEQHMKKSNIETDAIKKEIITKDMEKTLLEISELKNEIQLLDKINKQELKQNQVPSISKKKRKIKKRHVARTRTKKLSKNRNNKK